MSTADKIRLALTITEAADATGYSDDVIRAALSRGELTPRYGTKSKPVITIVELTRWLESLPTERWAS